MKIETVKSLIEKVEAVQFEWICLVPRLSGQFRRNAERCNALCEEVLKELKAEQSDAIFDNIVRGGS